MLKSANYFQMPKVVANDANDVRFPVQVAFWDNTANVKPAS